MQQRRATATERKEIMGLHRISKKRLLELCKKDKLYQTPALNDVLYLHYQGFQHIEGLEDYTGLKCLWLECNAISEIQGLENQPNLKCLFLQSNLIKHIENLEHCTELDTLNLASNHICKIENCGSDVLPHLNTLNLSSNYLKDCEGLRDLENCRSLSVLDLSNNRIDDILVVKVFAKMPQLRVLILQGNPVVSKVPQYRKTIILECKELTYLDSRPVFPKDRACAEAWKRGGYEEERKENERWNRKERRQIRDSVNATIRLRNRHLGPDAQLELLHSFDSENDNQAAVKKRRQAEVNASVSLELGIWDEVDDNKSETSSDMNVSSSTSVLSSSDSNGNVLSDTEANTHLINNMNVVEKKFNNSTAKILELAQTRDMAIIKNLFKSRKNEVEGKSVSNKECTDASLEKLHSFKKCSDDSSDTKGENKEDYNETVDAILKVTMNNLSNDSPKKRVKLQVEKIETNESDMDIDKVTETMLEKLNQNISERVETKKEKSEKFYDSTASSQEEKLDLNKEFNMGNRWNSSQEIINEKRNAMRSEQRLFRETKSLEKIEAIDKTIITKSQIDNIHRTNSFITQTPQIIVTDCTSNNICRNETSKVENLPIEDKSDSAIMTQMNEFSKTVEIVTERRFQETSATIAAYEKETKELKSLLQKLEDENDKLYNINTSYRQILEVDIREEIKYKDTASNESSKKVCDKIIGELVKTLELQEQKRIEKLKSYEFVDLEFDEEFSYTGSKKSEEPVKSICDVLSSFNAFLKEGALRNSQEIKKCYTTPKQKAVSLQNLLKSPNIQKFNEDTYETLDAQLAELKELQSTDVKQLVDRVYAQKDKYNDKLEVVDGKLMIVKKDTGEIEDMTSNNNDDNEIDAEDDKSTDYDTTESDNEVEEENLRKWEKVTSVQNSFTMPYKSIMHTPAVQLIVTVMEKNNQSKLEKNVRVDDDHGDDDQFYSLEKKNYSVFSNIDEEFFKKLNFGQLKVSDIDENHIVACVRSYEDLKRFMKCSKEERCLTEEENTLLEQMLACTEPKEDNKKVGDNFDNALTIEENLLLKKIVERSKEIKNEDKQKKVNAGRVGEGDVGDIQKEKKNTQQKEGQQFVRDMVVLFEYNGNQNKSIKKLKAQNIVEINTTEQTIKNIAENNEEMNKMTKIYKDKKDDIEEEIIEGKEYEKFDELLNKMELDIRKKWTEDLNDDNLPFTETQEQIKQFCEYEKQWNNKENNMDLNEHIEILSEEMAQFKEHQNALDSGNYDNDNFEFKLKSGYVNNGQSSFRFKDNTAEFEIMPDSALCQKCTDSGKNVYDGQKQFKDCIEIEQNVKNEKNIDPTDKKCLSEEETALHAELNKNEIGINSEVVNSSEIELNENTAKHIEISNNINESKAAIALEPFVDVVNYCHETSLTTLRTCNSQVCDLHVLGDDQQL